MLDGVGVKQWPSNLVLERQILGSMLAFPDSATYAKHTLHAKDFYNPRYGSLFDTFCACMLDGAVDRIMVRAQLDANPVLRIELEDLEVGSGLLFEDRIELACKLIQNLAVLRKTAEAALSVASRLLTQPLGPEADEVIDWATSTMTEALAGRDTGSSARDMEDIIGDIIRDTLEPPPEQRVIATPIRGLNTFLEGGWKAGQHYVIAGRPGTGKTSFAVECAMHAAESGKRAIVYSFEMKDRRLVERALASRAEVLGSLIRRPHVLREQQKAQIISAGMRMAKLPIQVAEASGWTIDQLVRHAKREHARRAVDLIVIDYAQLAKVKGKRSREEEVACVSGETLALAHKLDLSTLLLAQLNRDVDKRADKKPVLSDLRESGALEQDADSVIFTARDENNNSELIVGKNRDGEPGSVPVRFEGRFTRFVDIDS